MSEENKNKNNEPEIDTKKILDAIEGLKPTKDEDGKVKETKLSLDEVKKLVSEGIQMGAVTSKDQLNKNITSLKEEVSDLKKDKSDLEKEKIDNVTKLAELQTTIDDASGSEDEKSDLEKLKIGLEEKLDESDKKLKLMENQALDAIEKVGALEKDINSKALENYRLQKISETDGKIISEIVEGTTRDEIDASVVVAKSRYDEIVEGSKKTTKVHGDKDDKDDNIKDKATVIKRIDLDDKQIVSQYKTEREKTARLIYKEAGFDV